MGFFERLFKDTLKATGSNVYRPEEPKGRLLDPPRSKAKKESAGIASPITTPESVGSSVSKAQEYLKAQGSLLGLFTPDSVVPWMTISPGPKPGPTPKPCPTPSSIVSWTTVIPYGRNVREFLSDHIAFAGTGFEPHGSVGPLKFKYTRFRFRDKGKRGYDVQVGRVDKIEDTGASKFFKSSNRFKEIRKVETGRSKSR